MAIEIVIDRSRNTIFYSRLMFEFVFEFVFEFSILSPEGNEIVRFF